MILTTKIHQTHLRYLNITVYIKGTVYKGSTTHITIRFRSVDMTNILEGSA